MKLDRQGREALLAWAHRNGYRVSRDAHGTITLTKAQYGAVIWANGSVCRLKDRHRTFRNHRELRKALP